VGEGSCADDDDGPAACHRLSVEMTEDEFHQRQIAYIKKPQNPEELKEHEAKLKKFTAMSSYISGAYDKDDGFQALTKKMEELEAKHFKENDKPNRMFYMALPPSVFTVVAAGLKKNCYAPNGINRIVIEKPFGKDLESCREMMSALKKEWTEDETYRIDHYLGKEMIKNMLVLRFGNVFFDSSFNRNYVSNVQITFKEPFGTEGRGGYFDEFGIIRDVCQNRELSRGSGAKCGWADCLELDVLSRSPDLMQTLSILAMERPVSFAAEDVRDEKVGVVGSTPTEQVTLRLNSHFMCTSRSRFSAASLPSRARTPSSVNTSRPTASPATSTTTPSPRGRSAPLSRRWSCGSTTPDGRVFLSS
jgi:glucose-6-phosphate 1-dehydrogenase